MGNNPIRRDSDDRVWIYQMHDPGHVFTDFDEIKALDRDFWEITKDLPVRTGSLFRIRSDALKNWRIGVTDENRERIKAKADEFRVRDYQEAQRDKSIEGMESTTETELMHASMVRAMVHLAKEIMIQLDDGEREFHVCELAAAFGKTSLSLAASLVGDSIGTSILERTHFHLVDYSAARLEYAREKLLQVSPASIKLAPENDDRFLRSTTTSFDIVFSHCHLHKKTFVGDTIRSVEARLVDNGVFISSDWHSALSDHPFMVYELLQRIGVDNRRLRLFQTMFSRFMRPVKDLEPDEQKALAEHQQYWVHVHDEIRGSAVASKSRHYVLGAFDTTKQRLATIKDSGLITDIDKIRKAFPAARLHQNPANMRRNSDMASVIMAMKKAKR